MDRTEAARTLEEITRRRTETRRQLLSSWYGRIVVGAFLVGAAALNAIDPGDALAWVYWIGGLALGTALVIAHHIRAEREAGIEARTWDASTILLLVMVAVLVVVNRITDGTETALAICLVAAAFTAAFGWLAHDPVEAASALAMVALAGAFALLEPSEIGTWVNGGIGVILIVAALLTRARERARAPLSIRAAST